MLQRLFGFLKRKPKFRAVWLVLKKDADAEGFDTKIGQWWNSAALAIGEAVGDQAVPGSIEIEKQ